MALARLIPDIASLIRATACCHRPLTAESMSTRRASPRLLRFTLSNSQVVKQPSEIRRGLGRPRGWPSRVPAVARRVFALEDRGAERRLAPPAVCTPWRACAPLWRRDAAPIGAPRGGLRSPGRAPADRAFPALALSVAIITVANGSREGRSAPGASPCRPGRRACEARGRGRRTPLRLQTPPATPSNERGCRNIYVGT